MRLSFKDIFLGGLAVAAVGYGIKKCLDAKSANDKAKGPKAKDLLQNAEEWLGKTRKRVKLAQSDCKNALSDCKNAFARFGDKKLHVRSHGMSMFVRHFNQLKGHQFFVKASDTQDLRKQVSVAQNFFNQLFPPTLAILRNLSASAKKNKKTKKKLEDVKAYCYKVEERLTEACGVIEKLLAVKRVVELFTEQITKCDVLFLSLSQDAIATMKKTQLQSFSLQPRRKRSALRYCFNAHDFERFFENPHHRQRPKAPRESAKGFEDHERADECSRKRAL